MVYVEAFGQKFATEVKQACLSCVWDETFVISLRNLDKDVFEEGVIRCVFVLCVTGMVWYGAVWDGTGRRRCHTKWIVVLIVSTFPPCEGMLRDGTGRDGTGRRGHETSISVS